MVKGRSGSIDAAIGARLSALRKSRGLSQGALATSVSTSYQQLQKYEKGTNRISARALVLFADALDVPVKYFFEDVKVAEESVDTIHRTTGNNAQTADLVAAFESIESPEQRSQVLELVKTLAKRE